MATNPATTLNKEGSTRAENLISVLSERLVATANARNVYGEPVEAHNRTIIPVAKIGYGLGAGAGARGDQNSGGGGGGGGVGAKPAGYIEITDDRTRYVAFSTPKKIIAAVAVGFAAGYLVRHFGR